MLKYFLDKLPYVRKLKRDNAYLANENKQLSADNSNFYRNCAFPPGHFYSVLVSVDEAKEHASQIWKEPLVDNIPGIDLQTQKQIDLLKSFVAYYADLPFKNEKQEGTRYYFTNDYYCHTDGIVLYSMMRHFKPKRIIEIGSGFSSAAMLDTNEMFFNNQIHLTFIEPYPDRLYSLISENDKAATTIIEKNIQSISLEQFQALEAGDILFVDSTHVVKTGSDVNYILFQILPVLKPGVLIHFHDVYYPFEYPMNWVLEGRNWNEDYFLRSFLMYNNGFEIMMFNNYLHQLQKQAFAELPLCYKNHGSGLWIQKK